MIDLSCVRLPDETIDLVTRVLQSGMIAQGPVVERFEQLVADRTGTSHAVAVSSGTAALELALRASGIGPGDEVITTPLTFIATINAIVHTGATAVLVDIDPNTHTIDPEQVAAATTEHTRAVLPVHLYGHPADLGALNLPIIEDAAQALGGHIDGRPVGSWGVGCFSFYATKNVTTGEGGCITTNDPTVAAACRHLRNQGMQARYDYVTVGWNLRMTDVAAAIGIPQLQQFDNIQQRRTRNAERLTSHLADVTSINTPAHHPGHAWHQYTITVSDGRDRLAANLRQHGIGTGVYYPKLPAGYAPYRNHPQIRTHPTPNAEKACQQVLSLPIHPHLDDDDIDLIGATVRRLAGA